MKSTNLTNKKKSLSKKEIQKDFFLFVAIGASAGGLEAITQLLQNLPSNTGMAFIYVQHLNPDHKSMLTAILSKSSLMKVLEAKNGMLIEPNNFYVIPPDKEMTVTDGHLKLISRKKSKEINLPIDTFFSSLAEKHKEDVIGIILSGSATDGTRGLKAIRQEGGLTFAQDDSAKFSSMPKSAIAEGVVDFILSPKEIALKLIHLSKNGYVRPAAMKTGKEDEIENSNSDLKTILQLLYKITGVDFSHYKMPTIKRRIIRRMPLHKIKTLKEYAELLGHKNNEVDLLYADLLINVTDFFRDPDAFLFLKTTLLPQILKLKETSDETLRIWVPACSTGEEAYSIAMMILEIQDSKSTKVPVQIFATDLSGQAISKARNGEYSERQLESLSPKRLQRFFTKSKDNYRITKSLRDICVFAQHNILRDPPFSRIDLISCCNLLIYLDAAVQKKAIATFHYALNESGYLMLGRSETIGKSAQLFTPLNKKFKIYLRKKNTNTRSIPDITPPFSHTLLPEKKGNTTLPQNKFLGTNGHIESAIDSFLLTRYMPACAIINHDMEILQFRGSTSLYLRHSYGKASFNILKMARPEFAFELRNAIHNGIKTKQTVRKTGIEIKNDSALRIVTLEVAPLKIEGEEPLLCILFTEQQRAEISSDNHRQGKGGKNNSEARIKKLEEELAAARADMLSITHDQEAANEELQSANEEVVSNNEELRTLNEELETSKEEIESTNEELISTNGELQTRNEQLVESNEYSEAIIATIHNPMIVLNKNLQVKSANKQFYDKFQVAEKETIGTSLYKLGNHQWDIPQLRKLFELMDSKNGFIYNFEVVHSFQSIGEKIMLLNARRVIQKSNEESLIFLVIEDITEQANFRKKEKKLFNELEQKKHTLEVMNEQLISFNYISSHDLQEPLRKIKTFAKLISKDEYKNLSDKGKDYFSRMQEAADGMQALIEDLLAYSRTTTAERKFEKTDLKIIVDKVKKDFEEVLLEKKATIEAADLCEANIIRFQFSQLLYNLIGNSLKFSKPDIAPHIIIMSEIIHGGKLINEKLSPKIDYCHIIYTDNGIGFDTKYNERIFEVFQRLHPKDEYQGTGIGLAICKRIVENHNGIITATGKLNKGARFDIYIPI